VYILQKPRFPVFFDEHINLVKVLNDSVYPLELLVALRHFSPHIWHCLTGASPCNNEWLIRVDILNGVLHISLSSVFQLLTCFPEPVNSTASVSTQWHITSTKITMMIVLLVGLWHLLLFRRRTSLWKRREIRARHLLSLHKRPFWYQSNLHPYQQQITHLKWHFFTDKQTLKIQQIINKYVLHNTEFLVPD